MKLNDPSDFARKFAVGLHQDAGQRYGGRPYSVHLDRVVGVLLDFGFTSRHMLAAGFLHDLCEDVKVPFEVIYGLFGEKIGDLVKAVTDAEGPNRKARKALTYPQIKAAGSEAVALKLADRIANVEYGVEFNDRRMNAMYQAEAEEFQAQLRTLGEHSRMWKRLEIALAKIPAPIPA